MRVFEAANPKDADELTNQRDVLWLCQALRGDFGQYRFSGPFAEDSPEDTFVVMEKL
jgi:hypothetical protein